MLILWIYSNKEAFCYAKMLYILTQKCEFGFNWKKSWRPPSQEGGLCVLMELAFQGWLGSAHCCLPEPQPSSSTLLMATEVLWPTQLLQSPGHAAEQLLLSPKGKAEQEQRGSAFPTTPAECSEHFSDSFCKGKAGERIISCLQALSQPATLCAASLVSVLHI